MITPEDLGKFELEYIKYIDSPNANTTYIGVAKTGTLTSGALWRIKKILTSGYVTTILWADGNTFFDNVWDNRASLSYS